MWTGLMNRIGLFFLALLSSGSVSVNAETSSSQNLQAGINFETVLIACTFPEWIKIKIVDGAGPSNIIEIYEGKHRLFRERWNRSMDYLSEVVKEWNRDIELARLNKTGIEFGLVKSENKATGLFPLNIRKYQFRKCARPSDPAKDQPAHQSSEGDAPTDNKSH